MTGAQLFDSELALIERVISWICARRSLRGADAEDFASTVKLRLMKMQRLRLESASGPATFVS